MASVNDAFWVIKGAPKVRRPVWPVPKIWKNAIQKRQLRMKIMLSRCFWPWLVSDEDEDSGSCSTPSSSPFDLCQLEGNDEATPTELSQVAKLKCLSSQNTGFGQSATVSSSNTTLSGEEGDGSPLVAPVLVEVHPPQHDSTQIVCTNGKVSGGRAFADLESAKCFDEILTVVESSNCEDESQRSELATLQPDKASVKPPSPLDDSPVTKEEEEELMKIVREHDRHVLRWHSEESLFFSKLLWPLLLFFWLK